MFAPAVTFYHFSNLTGLSHVTCLMVVPDAAETRGCCAISFKYVLFGVDKEDTGQQQDSWRTQTKLLLLQLKYSAPRFTHTGNRWRCPYRPILLSISGRMDGGRSGTNSRA